MSNWLRLLGSSRWAKAASTAAASAWVAPESTSAWKTICRWCGSGQPTRSMMSARCSGGERQAIALAQLGEKAVGLLRGQALPGSTDVRSLIVFRRLRSSTKLSSPIEPRKIQRTFCRYVCRKCPQPVEQPAHALGAVLVSAERQEQLGHLVDGQRARACHRFQSSGRCSRPRGPGCCGRDPPRSPFPCQRPRRPLSCPLNAWRALRKTSETRLSGSG